MNKKTTVLIVDDEPDILSLYSIILRDEGYEVWEASTGRQGLQQTRERRPDLLLQDVNLPDINGLAICKQIKADPDLRDVFVILFSGWATSPEHKAEGLACGADEYLAKPMNFDEFRARIRTLVRLQETTAALRAGERHHRQLLETLRASEERFRQLAENINDVFWIVDPATKKTIYVSRGYEKIWGRSCESRLAESPGWIETIHPDDRDRVGGATLAKQIAGTYNVVYRIMHPNGSVRWIQDRAFPVRNEAGEVYRVVGIAEDITKRKQAEADVGEAEAKYRTIFENATEGIFRSTPDGKYLTANPALARMLGYQSAEDLITSTVDIARQIYVKPAQRADLKRSLEAQKSVDGFELECLRKDGRKIWISLNGRAVRDKRGAVLYYECTTQDITTRKEAQEELRQLPWRIIEAGEAERLRVALELHDGVNQTIASAKMRLRKVQDAAAGLSPAAREILSRCEKLLVHALEENRRIAHNLHPSVLDELGLAAACRNLCAELHARTNLMVKSSIARLDQRLPIAIELNLFRIIQEAFSNIEKHALAKNVDLRVSVQRDEILVRIRDDGQGFDPARAKAGKMKRHGFGLTSLRERAAILGGTSEFKSTPGHGTVVTVRVPWVNGGSWSPASAANGQATRRQFQPSTPHNE